MRIKFIPQTINDIQKKAMIFEIIFSGKTNSGKIKSTIQTVNILITKPKRPKVTILIGRVITFKKGFIKKLIKPNIIPAKANVCQLPFPVNSTPGIYITANQIPNIPAIICRNNLHIFFSLYQHFKKKSINFFCFGRIFYATIDVRLFRTCRFPSA